MTKIMILGALLASTLAGCVETTDGAATSAAQPEAMADEPITCALPAQAKWHGEKLTSVDQLAPPYRDGDRKYAALALAGDPVYQAWVTGCLGATL